MDPPPTNKGPTCNTHKPTIGQPRTDLCRVFGLEGGNGNLPGSCVALTH